MQKPILATQLVAICSTFLYFVWLPFQYDNAHNNNTLYHYANNSSIVMPSIGCPDTVRTYCPVPDTFIYFSQFISAGGTVNDVNMVDTNSFSWVADIDTTMSCPDTIRRSYRIADFSGTYDTCEYLILLLDTIPPVAVCRNITAYLDSLGQVTLVPSQLDSISSDDCTTDLIYSTNFPLFFGCNDIFGNNSNITEAILTVTDRCGNTATCISQITVRDTIFPIITCQDTLEIEANPNECFAINVVVSTPDYSDNCNFVTVSSSFNGQPINNNTQFPVGYNSVAWSAKDTDDNTSTCFQIVHVVDVQSPTISCPSNRTISTVANSCSAIVTFTNPVANDNCPNPIVTQVAGIPSGQSFPLGTTINTFVATDGSGNTATCSFAVNVVDSIPPIIACPVNITISNGRDSCGATFFFSLPSATDNCALQSVVQSSGLVSGSFFPIGNAELIFIATDQSNNKDTCTWSITVLDNQIPTITCPDDIVLDNDANECNALVTYALPSYSDNCPNPTITQLAGLPSGVTFPLGSTTNVFQVIDANGNTATCSVIIEIVDNEAPLIECPDSILISLNENCELEIPDISNLLDISDNCNGITINQSPEVGDIIEYQQGDSIWIDILVEDAAGNTSSCNVLVSPIDNTGPDVVCKSNVVIAINEYTSMAAQSFIQSAEDNCGSISRYEGRRMNNGCGQDSLDGFGQTIEFCCDDVNDTVLVVIRVFDLQGNFTECMVNTIITDEQAPMIVSPLPDITISCLYDLDTTDLSIFGKIVDNVDQIDSINIDDSNYPNGFVGFDGLVSDNCPQLAIEVNNRIMLNMCRVGMILRDFTITDNGNNSIAFTQKITVVNDAPFDSDNISWPLSGIEYIGCPTSVPNPDVTGRPVITNNRCSQAAATYADSKLTNPLHCGYIKRTWTIIDWCQYQRNTVGSPGKFTYDQYIIIKNNVAPTISNATKRDTSFCTNGNTCQAQISLPAQATDDCLPLTLTWKYSIDLQNNGSIDVTGTGSNLNYLFPLGTHKINYEVKDQCGNSASSSRLITINDCKSPVAIVHHGLATNLQSPYGIASIWASDFDNGSSDQCTASGKLKFSFSSNTNDINREFTCDSLGQKDITIWVTDESGNQSQVNTYIIVQDNQNLCGLGNLVNIEGALFTEEKNLISDINVSIDGGETEKQMLTDSEGKYFFNDLAMYNNYEVQPYKNDGWLEGITSLDLVIMQRHILGITPLTSPYKLIAADINNSQTITASDINELRRLLLGIQSGFAKNKSWRFVDAVFTFIDPTHPWPFNEKMHYSALETNMYKSDFVGIKVGDVNGSIFQNYKDKVLQRNKSTITLEIENAYVKRGEYVSIPIYSASELSMLALQWSLQLNHKLDYIGLESMQLPIQPDEIRYLAKQDNGHLAMAYSNAEGININDKSPLITILCQVKEDGYLSKLIELSNDVIEPIIYDQDFQEYDIELKFVQPRAEDPVDIQISPNPFNDLTNIKLYQSSGGPITFTIYDNSGQMVNKFTENHQQGVHNIALFSRHFNNSYGVFYIKIKTADKEDIIKVIRIE